MTSDSSAPERRMPNRDQLLTPDDVAYRLQRPVAEVRDWLRKEKLRGTKIGKSWRITWSALDDFTAG